MPFHYCPVRASQGKAVRAEPVVAAYERGLVHHVGTFPELEEQMREWTPSDCTSPDRLDARVWAITDLIRAGIAYGDQPDIPFSPIEDPLWKPLHDSFSARYTYDSGYPTSGFPRPPEF